MIAGTIPRESIYLAQTPQAFRRAVLEQAIALSRGGADVTDEAALAELAGHPVHIVEGDADNVKITTAADLERARARKGSAASRAGTGYDLHRLVEGRPLVIGGVEIPFERGPIGHSDADVACHAATDAVLGAACSATSAATSPTAIRSGKGHRASSCCGRPSRWCARTVYEVVNLDVIVILERPKIAPHLAAIRAGLAAALGVAVDRVSVKGKTNEGVDAVGRGEAIAAHAIALLMLKSER